MSIKMSKLQTVLFTISILFTSFIVMWSTPLNIITNDLYEIFYEQSNLVTALLSWPMLITGLVSLLAGKILDKVSAKTELVMASCLMLFGIAAGWGENLYWLAFCCVMMACGAGFANTAAMVLISDVFVDADARSRNMGYYNGFMSVAGAGISIIAGFCAQRGWNRVFDVNWFTILVLVMAVLFLPRIQPVEKEEDLRQDVAVNEKSDRFGKQFWSFFVSSFIAMMGFDCVLVFISVYINECELGNTALTGLSTGIFTGVSIIGALCFSKIYAKTGRKMAIIIFGIPALLFIWGWMAPSQTYIIISSCIYGICYSLLFTMIFAYAADCVPQHSNGKAMGIMTFNSMFSASIGVYVISAIMNVVGSIRQTYIWVAVFFVIAAVTEIVCQGLKEGEGSL